MISNSGHDENGKYSGGKAGDQSGTEWAIINWYNRPWTCILRHPDPAVRKEIAVLARAAAQNNKIGYDQGDRYTFWEQLKACNYDPSKIEVACEADCSAGVAAIVKAVGYRLGVEKLKIVSIYAYTGNLRSVLKTAGFDVLTEKKYLTSDKHLLSGDVLLYDGHHTAINLDNGEACQIQDVELDLKIALPSLIKGNSSGYVRTLQQILTARGYNTNGVDGIFGAGTEAAVAQFQAAAGVKVNYPGTVGAKTWTELLKGI